ncbi:aldehyde dehydrogenase family protein [soil metagenome]
MAVKSPVKIKATNGQVVTKSAAPVVKRAEIKKTWKMYIDGKFPRTESGRYYVLKDAAGTVIANICKGSRKDLRDAVVSNRKAQEGWAKRSAYNKGQILYRIAETLEGRKAQFVETLLMQGTSHAKAQAEVESTIDLLVYYAGWTDKYIQIFSSVNPVESAHFNFSYPEACGIVSVFATEQNGLLGLVSMIAPIIAGGNTCTVMAAELFPMTAIDFAEVMHASDVPSGVVNILTGPRKEFLSHASSHMDINAIVYADLTSADQKLAQINASLNVKRVIDFSKEALLSPYRIFQCQETKTTWHPVGI